MSNLKKGEGMFGRFLGWKPPLTPADKERAANSDERRRTLAIEAELLSCILAKNPETKIIRLKQ